MHVLGIDAGGTKTVCYLADGEGRILGEGRAGGANLQVHGELDAEKALHAATEEATGARPLAVAAVCLGMAGVDRPDDRRTAQAILRRLGFRGPALVVNDALVALVAACGRGPGLVLISGTGSIAYGVSPAGLAARAGGWGFALADEGSGYWIGREALAAVMRASDGRGPATDLLPRILTRFGVAAAEDLVREVYDGGLKRDVIATLCPAVAAADAAGDAVATDILARAAAELALAARSVVTRLEMDDAVFPTRLVGSIFGVVPALTERVMRLLAVVARRSDVARLEVEPAMGAVHLALDAARGVARIPPYVGAA